MRLRFIICEDGSTDGAKEILTELSTRIPMQLLMGDQLKGYSRAVRDGMRLLEAPYLLCLDSDGQCDPQDFERVWSLRDPRGVVLGWRVNRADNAVRKLMSRAFRVPYRILFGIKLNDPSCPYVLAAKPVIEGVVDEVGEMKQGFWWEFIARVHRKGVKIHETPVNHRDRAAGETQVYKASKVPGIALSHLAAMVRIWRQTRA